MDASVLSTTAQLLLGLLVFFLTCLYFYLRQHYAYWEKKGVPFEKPSLWFGNTTFIMRKSFWEFFRKMKMKHSGDYVGIFLGWKPTLLIQSPDLARRILVKDFDHFQDRQSYSSYSADPLGALNLFTVKNPIWSQMRQELSPLFTSSRLKSISELMSINAKHLVERIQKYHVDKDDPANIKELSSMYTSDTVAYSVFGLRVSALKDEDSPLWYITNKMVKWTFWRGLEFTTVFYIPVVATLLRLPFFSQAANDYIKTLFRNVVEQRQKAGISNNKDLVNHLINLKNNMKLPAGADADFGENLMLAQAAIFILGSIETSSTTINYCLHELAHHPEEQEKLYEDIDEAVQRTGKEILEYDDLIQLKYLNACIMETLRKYPPVANVDRKCNKKYQINDKLTIEKDTAVFVNIVALHYDERVYPEPEQWRPERMYNYAETDNLQYSFLPFGDGPRFCIGKRYGFIQVRVALAQLLHKFRVEPVPHEPYNVVPDPYSAILAPKSGGCVKFVLR